MRPHWLPAIRVEHVIQFVAPRLISCRAFASQQIEAVDEIVVPGPEVIGAAGKGATGLRVQLRQADAVGAVAVQGDSTGIELMIDTRGAGGPSCGFPSQQIAPEPPCGWEERIHYGRRGVGAQDAESQVPGIATVVCPCQSGCASRIEGTPGNAVRLVTGKRAANLHECLLPACRGPIDVEGIPERIAGECAAAD